MIELLLPGLYLAASWWSKFLVGAMFRLSKSLITPLSDDDVTQCSAPLWCTCTVPTRFGCIKSGIAQSEAGKVSMIGLTFSTSFIAAVITASLSRPPLEISLMSFGVSVLASGGGVVALGGVSFARCGEAVVCGVEAVASGGEAGSAR